MNPETLIRMANDIGAFFAGGASPDEAAQNVLLHIRRYWDPRMRAQIIEHYRAGGTGLDDHVRAAIKLLSEQ